MKEQGWGVGEITKSCETPKMQAPRRKFPVLLAADGSD